MAYIETPRTDAGNATLMTNRHNLNTFSTENSLLSPLKRKDTRDDLLSQMRNGRGSLKTPRARMPLADRRNLPSLAARQEFTPLLQSVTKKNFERKGRRSGQPETPAFLKGSLQHSDSPALPGTEASALYGSELGSSIIGDSDGTPIPQITSSSAQSTPLVVLPKRDANGASNDQGNLMTLREQENIINKIEKENFGLKLKIHFLEESLRKSGPGFNEAALKENTDLKVDRITLQKELSRCKTMLGQAERDVEALRQHIEEVQARAKHKLEDKKLQIELESLRQTLIEKETDVEEMRIQVETAGSRNDEAQKLKANIEDLEIDLREKDRLIDERDDEIDNIKAQARKDAEELDGAEIELDEAKKRIEDLENDGGKIAEAARKLEEAQAELQEALEDKERAEAYLDELRDEMSNKSINTKGLSRQLEEKANRLQDELTGLRGKDAQLQSNFDDKIREVKRLEEELQEREQDADVRDQRLKDQNELLRNEYESMSRKCQSLNEQMQLAAKDLQSKSEEKDLLHSRHDALTNEYQQLQKDLLKAHSLVAELQQSLTDEKRHAEDNDRQLRSEAKDEIDRLSTEINELHRELEKKEAQTVIDRDLWESQRRAIESKRQKAEEQVSGLQRTVSKLHETKGTLSDREVQLQEALESEKQRHESEEAILQRLIQDLSTEIEEKRQTLEDLRSKFSESREDLRISQRDQADLEVKVQALEDEIEVLQTGLDEEIEKAKEEINVIEQEAGSLRSQLAAAERSKEDGMSRARTEEVRLRDEIVGLQRELPLISGGRGRELSAFKQEVQRLEARICELESQLASGNKFQENAAELSILQKDLSTARTKEIDFLQREAAQKDLVRDLKQKVARLESQLHEAELARLSVDSPKSSTSGSTRKTELIELRSQLSNMQQQLKESRTKSKDDLKALQQRLLASEKQSQNTVDVREQLEADLSHTQHERASLQTANAASAATIARLRTRISSLESDRAQRHGVVADNTIAEERRDLHDLLKDSKLQAEDLQLQIASRETSIAVAATREKDLRAQLKRVREERSLQAQRSNALAEELENLQRRYERALENLSRQQRVWEDERRSMASRVRFPNTSISELYANEKELEKRHVGELRGLAKQIQWLRAKLHREGTFREGLVFEKKWLLMRIGMFEACNATDLELLSEMGVNPQTHPAAATRLRLGDALRANARGLGDKKKRSLRAVVFAVIAGARMRRMASDWAIKRKTKEALGKKLERTGKRKESYMH